jgi:hypothetical protein
MVCGVTNARRARSALDSPGSSSSAVSSAYWLTVASCSRSAALLLLVAALVLAPDPVDGLAVGGLKVTLQMFGTVDTATVVDLNASSSLLTVPASVTVPAGKNSVSFYVTAATVTSAEQDFIFAMIVTNSLVEDTLQSSTITINP